MRPTNPSVEAPESVDSSSARRLSSTARHGSPAVLVQRGRLPIHLQISEMLAREIKAGILLDGERLEPERVLAQRLGIAVGTLRKALADLGEKGMLERVQGSGNYVRNVDTNNTIYGFFRLELLTGGGLPSAEPVSVDKVEADDSVSFGKDDSYYRIRRLRRLSDVDAALEEIWLDASYVKRKFQAGDLNESLYQFYKEDLGFWIARVEDSISVSSPPDWRPADFATAAGPVWGYVERCGWDQHGLQAEYSRTWFDTASARYVSRIK